MVFRKTGRIALAAMLSVALVGRLSADPPHGLSLENLEQLARDNNPGIRIAAAHRQRAAGARVQAGLYPNTRIGYHATEVGNLGTAGAQGFFLSQKILQRDKRGLDIAVAEQGVQQANFQSVAMESRVINDVRLRFYDALVAGRQMDLAVELMTISDEAVESSRTLFKAGQVGEHIPLQAELERDNVRIFHDSASNQQFEARRRLCAAVGLDDLDVNMLIGNLDRESPAWSWHEMLAALMTNSPELAAAEANVVRAERGLERARQEIKPDYDVMVSLRHHNVTAHEIANIQVGFPIPYLDRNQGNIQSARADLVIAQHAVRQLQLRLHDRLSTVYRQYRDAYQQAMRYRSETVPRAERSMALSREGYKHGQLDYLNLLTAQRTYFQVKLSYLKSLGQLHRTMVLLEGQLLSGSLNTN
jgi:cobalt-zinc-cadmium efflux system outer membrane protein